MRKFLPILLLFSSCFTFNWGTIGYMEPGGSGTGADFKTTKKCELLNSPIFSDVLNLANADNGNPKMWKDVDTEVPYLAIPPCVILKGTPVK